MVAITQVKQGADTFYFDILPKATLRAFKKCSDLGLFLRNRWYLAGGTALALQAGHQRSVDLDFFTERKNFDEKKMEESLLKVQDKWVTNFLNKGTLYGEFFGGEGEFYRVSIF